MQQTSANKFHTFYSKGLTVSQIKFLTECENLFFAGASVCSEMLAVAFKNTGFTKGSPESTECLEAWKYWTAQSFCVDRNSLKTPIEFSQVFTEKFTGMNYDKYFYVTDKRVSDYHSYYVTINREYFESLDLSLIYELRPKEYYFTIYPDGRLFIQYQQIIGSRFIALIK